MKYAHLIRLTVFSYEYENQQKQILQQAESRLDKNLDFFLRFGKDLWINEKKLILTDSGK